MFPESAFPGASLFPGAPLFPGASMLPYSTLRDRLHDANLQQTNKHLHKLNDFIYLTKETRLVITLNVSIIDPD